VKEKDYAPPSLSEGTPEQVRRRRQWELWSVEDKNLFFEGLFEASYLLPALLGMIDIAVEIRLIFVAHYLISCVTCGQK